MKPPTSENHDQEESFEDIEPFFDLLYNDGDPSNREQLDDRSQTPLYDSLRSLGNRYTDQTLIAKGGMKEIYRALDRRTSRFVAIARPIAKQGKDHYDAFLREAHITAKLEHPGIIKLFGMDVDDDGKPFFTMELKTGRSLRELIKDHTKDKNCDSWPMLHRLQIILRICESLSYAHSQRVLHLDIKPENVQVGSFGEVQLCDWGMGVVTQRDENNKSETLLDPDLYGSLQREIRGTPIYMAPELFDAKNPKTPQMDIYSLGCLMEVLMQAKVSGAAKAGAPPENSPLNHVIRKAKAKEPSKRYKSVAQMQRDITRYIEGYSMSVEKVSLFRECRLFYRRNRGACNITLSFLLLLVVTVFLFLNSLNNSRIEAFAAKDRTIEAMTALKKEKLSSETRLKKQAEVAQVDTSDLIHLEFLDQLNLEKLADMLHERLDAVITNQPADDAMIWVEKFWLDFLTQRFDHAMQLHEDGKRVSKDLVPLAHKYASRLGDRNYLSTADFKELLSELFAIPEKDRTSLVAKMMQYDLKNPRSIEERIEILHQLLKLLNPNWKNQIFTYHPDDHSIRLGGKGLVHLSLTVKKRPPLLTLVEPRKLDLRGTSITNLEQINALNLSEIDLRQTPVKSLLPLTKMKKLARITVSSGQFSASELSALPSFVEVSVK